MKAPVMTVLLAILTADARWDGWECRGRTILPEPSLALRGGTGVDREAFGFYQLLGVERDASESVLTARMDGPAHSCIAPRCLVAHAHAGSCGAAQEIRRAYRRLAIASHPDRNPADDATAKFQTLQVRGHMRGLSNVLHRCRWARWPLRNHLLQYTDRNVSGCRQLQTHLPCLTTSARVRSAGRSRAATAV